MRRIGLRTVFSVAILGMIGAFFIGYPAMADSASAKESPYDRVLRTGTIRCGYTSWDPLFFIDPKTNEKRGIFHDEMEEVGKRLNLKIVWQEEIGWGSVTESVKNGRVDMACSGYWLNPARIKNVSSSVPQIYSPLYLWVRQNDTRTLNSPDDLNSDKYTVGTIDGSAEGQIIAARFPKAKLFSIPELGTDSDNIQNLVSGKVDFIIEDSGSMATYIASNPGKVKNPFPEHPLNVFPNVMLIPPDDMRLKEVIDDTLRNIEYDGTLDAIVKTYHAEGIFLRNPKPTRISP